MSLTEQRQFFSDGQTGASRIEHKRNEDIYAMAFKPISGAFMSNFIFYRGRTVERCRALSEKTMAGRYHTRYSAPASCTVLCRHKG